VSDISYLKGKIHVTIGLFVNETENISISPGQTILLKVLVRMDFLMVERLLKN